MTEPEKKFTSDDFEFEDTETIKGSTTSFKDTVLLQFHKCSIEGSKEMTTGGIMKRVIEGKVIEFPVPNQVEIYINTVEVLQMILNKKIEENWKVVRERMLNFYKTNYDNLRERDGEKDNLTNSDMQEQLLNADREYQEQLRNQLSYIDKQYEDRRVKNYRYLFETLCILIDHLKYFEEAKKTI